MPPPVVHGNDPVFPVAHGKALARAVADAKFVKIEGDGHEIHSEDWETIISAIDEHDELSSSDRGKTT
ncbi:hypothetical protein [Rhizobium sp. 1399]|uniref:alpha/beta fold hydrolase n=1 Tax=Rhizobium sp. 1399 TaxID=2817758 RepID=UPI002854269A|nr:hypothetical protein [Rhizobium sp. 1399]MDR6665564.1 pimeloyl-ACP methyl ester carboxylesterase [Rhizobium sp. 1399]